MKRVALFVAWVIATHLAVASQPGEVSPPVAAPGGAAAVVRDPGGNFWTLVPAPEGRQLRVLPAQEPTAWIDPGVAGLSSVDGESLIAEPDGSIVIGSRNAARRFDFRFPERGSTAVAERIDPAHRAATPWRPVARFPASNHDLTAAVIADRMYVAGGVTSHFGFPARVHASDEIWELDARTWAWRAAARLSRARIYCATAAWDDRVWVIGGDVLAPEGTRRPTTLVEIFDPATGRVSPGPEVPFALPMPLALAAGGRLWVLGSLARDGPGQFASLGVGETAWRCEPDAPRGCWALAGAALNDQIYVCVPNTGLVVFDPATGHWTPIPGPAAPRSAQVAAWRGELWIAGGCDQPDWRRTQIYSPASRTWRDGPPLPGPLAWGAAAVIADHLVIAGGAGLHGRPEDRLYDFSDLTWALAAADIPPAPAIAQGPSFARWNPRALRDTGGQRLPLNTQRIYPTLRLSRPSAILPVPLAAAGGEKRLVVIDFDGDAWTVSEEDPSAPAALLLRLPPDGAARFNLQALAFHPRFPAEPSVYVLYNRVRPKPAENVLARLTLLPGAAPRLDPASAQQILRWPSDGHNGGDVRFGPDGFLYVSTGDRSQPGDPDNLGQRVDLIAGGVLRLDIDHRDAGKNYAVPPDNPFVGLPSVRPEFWAYGLRNPWRMSFAPTGELWLGDNGDDSWESIHLIRRGHNYGWSTYEGTHPFKRTRTLAGPTPRLTPPVIELPHSEARSVIGGLVYRGRALPVIFDHYIFGDFVTGSLWAFRWNGSSAADFRRVADTGSAIISLNADRQGEILLTRGDGQIHRLIAAPIDARETRPLPAKLSATGLFAATAELRPAPGVVPYELNAGHWSDGAQVRRWLALADRQPLATADASTPWSLPDGSAVVRTLQVPTSRGPRRTETQLMFREHGEWRFYTFAWNDAQDDADLVPADGATRTLPGPPPRSWRFASRRDCTVCHNEQTGFTIGLTLAQLNRAADYSGLGRAVGGQIEALVELGWLQAPATPAAALPRKANPADPTGSLEARARAYLDINCAHCHRPNGVGGRAAFQLLDTLPLARTGLVNGAPLVPLLGAGSRLIAPGQPEKSEIIHRMSLPAGGRMPLLGNEVTDTVGLELLRQWIRQLPVE